MRFRWALVFLAATVIGCGDNLSQDFSVSISHVDRESMPEAYGRATWNDKQECEFKIWHREDFTYECAQKENGSRICADALYMYVLGHELRHCFDGEFHD